ncbi:hypothetical protein HDU82_002471 [Entophlyctis luteolus]|nr:hypothetical protein HDU82_002471 [Entophlyctis luteolus]
MKNISFNLITDFETVSFVSNFAISANRNWSSCIEKARTAEHAEGVLAAECSALTCFRTWLKNASESSGFFENTSANADTGDDDRRAGRDDDAADEVAANIDEEAGGTTRSATMDSMQARMAVRLDASAPGENEVYLDAGRASCADTDVGSGGGSSEKHLVGCAALMAAKSASVSGSERVTVVELMVEFRALGLAETAA